MNTRRRRCSQVTSSAVFEKKEYTIEKLAVDELVILSLGDAESRNYLTPTDLKDIRPEDGHIRVKDRPKIKNRMQIALEDVQELTSTALAEESSDQFGDPRTSAKSPNSLVHAAICDAFLAWLDGEAIANSTLRGVPARSGRRFLAMHGILFSA